MPKAKQAKGAASRTQQVIKALSYPLRAEIFRVLSERGKGSATEIAKIIGETVPNVDHHLKVLAKLECVEEVEQVKRRGATEHFYVPTARPWVKTEDWDAMPNQIRKSYIGEAIELFLADCRAGFEGDTLGPDSRIEMSRDRLSVDAQGLGEVVEILDEALERVMDVQAQSTRRMAGSKEEPLTVPVLLSCFPLKG
jgi:DNA-binding transcriptional ArsR family regulator